MKCYGRPEKHNRKALCATCEFFTSCAYSVANPSESCDKRFHQVSYEEYSYSQEMSCDPVFPEDKNEKEENMNYSREDIVELVGFFCRIDVYTLSLLSDIVANNMTTTERIAKHRGVSRQAIHEKLVKSCEEYPELRAILRTYLYKCKEIVGGNSRAKREKKQDVKNQQLTFFEEG